MEGGGAPAGPPPPPAPARRTGRGHARPLCLGETARSSAALSCCVASLGTVSQNGAGAEWEGGGGAGESWNGRAPQEEEEGGGTPPSDPPPQTKVTIVRENEIVQKEILIWAIFGTQTFGLLGSRPPPPPLSSSVHHANVWRVR